MKENPLRKKLSTDAKLVGGWLTLADPFAAEMIASVGFDYVVVDMEHWPADVPQAMRCFQAITAGGSVPVARLPANDPVWIKRTLDAGAMGLIIPLINSVDEAKAAIRDSRFPPLGRRPFGGGRAAVLNGLSYIAESNDQIVIVLQFEQVDVLPHVDEILKLEGFDVCFIGATDLALSMGEPVPAQARSEKLEATVAELVAKIHAAGFPASTTSVHADHCVQRLSEGFNLVSLSSDSALMMANAKQSFAKVRENISR
jgi:4-hydroxy-2-oxoheptanedioate aldolase